MLQQFAAYNVWANERLLQCLQTVPEESQRKKLAASFPSLYDTVMHMWDAESIWWQRLKLQEAVFPPSNKFQGSLTDAASSLIHQNKLWKSWVDSASPAAIEHVFHYQNTKREKFRQPVFQMLIHVFNHGTYHRGQLVSMLRQLGIDKIPATDFIVWSRSRK